MINLMNLTVQEVDTILAGLRKLPMEIVAELHEKIFQTGRDQFDALQKEAQEEVPKE
jgi:hypothetical protein